MNVSKLRESSAEELMAGAEDQLVTSSTTARVIMSVRFQASRSDKPDQQ